MSDYGKIYDELAASNARADRQTEQERWIESMRSELAATLKDAKLGASITRAIVKLFDEKYGRLDRNGKLKPKRATR